MSNYDTEIIGYIVEVGDNHCPLFTGFEFEEVQDAVEFARKFLRKSPTSSVRVIQKCSLLDWI